MLLNKHLTHLFSRLRNGEHVEFGTSIVDNIKAFIIAVALLLEIWNKYEALVEQENLLFRISAESYESHLIAAADKERDRLFNEIKRELKFHHNSPDAAIKQAAFEILFVLKPYEHASKKNLFEETKFIQNFLIAINKPALAGFIALLPSIGAMLQRLATVNTNLYDLYQQRLLALEALEKMGKAVDIRKEVDAAFIDIIDQINIIHGYNEMTAKDAAIKTNLENAANYISGLLHQTERVLSRRDHHHKPATDEPSTPPATPPTDPTTPPTDPQAPDNTLPEAPDTPPQQPNITIPPINPDDLNPPAAGE
ncbi:MAG: DUF6261 family protein [Tannerellaceae bacterium]|jgi:hypothetical protein|nr:DUF6261 family protein [Tannerellaceae bacterium]